MLSIRVKGGKDAALRVVSRLRLWCPATSLGGVESLVEHRYTVEGPDSGVPDDLLRLSCGLEDAADLYEDLRRALDAEADREWVKEKRRRRREARKERVTERRRAFALPGVNRKNHRPP